MYKEVVSMSDLRMPDINSVVIAGNLTRDPAFRRTTNGTPVTNFWIASNRKFKDNNGQWRENVCYVGVVAWYKLAESCADNLHKGSAVIVEGELQSRSLRSETGRNRNIVEIKARRIQFLNKMDDATVDDAFSADDMGDDSCADDEDAADDNGKKESSEDTEDGITPDPSVETLGKKKTEDQNNPLKGDYDFGYEGLDF